MRWKSIITIKTRLTLKMLHGETWTFMHFIHNLTDSEIDFVIMFAASSLEKN